MLPDCSKTKAKIAQDPELAKLRVSGLSNDEIDEIIEARADPESYEVPMEGYTPEISKLDDVINEIRLLRLTLTNVFSKKKVKEDLNKKPITAAAKILDKKIWEREREDNMELLSRMGF